MVAGVAMLGALGCASNSTAAPEAGAEQLLPTLQVTTGAERVRFVFQVLNTGGDPVELVFPSGQSADFEVRRGGERIWRWSDEQMFTQAVREVTVAAGESLRFEAEWAPPAGTGGEMEAVATLTATGVRVDQAVRFSLP